MSDTKYLIVGSSHAALEAVRAIRMVDPDGSLTLITRDTHLPYSPTILPYMVSGETPADGAFLRDESYFTDNNITFVRGATLKHLDTATNTAVAQDGRSWTYEAVLLATGATPIIPPIDGLADVPFHVLRTLDDAVNLRDAIMAAKSAVVLGGGLVGMHAAENLVRAGADVTIVEMRDQVLPGYFDAEAANMIRTAFEDNGAHMMLGETVTGVAKTATGCTVTLKSGATIDTDVLVVGAGVRPVMDFLDGSGIDTDAGIVVDATMRTNIDNVYAAGDVAQGPDFFKTESSINGILPDAVEQGRVAGMAMANDSGIKPYAGGVPINTYGFYGHNAISVGLCDAPDGAEEIVISDPTKPHFRKVVLDGNRLLGVTGINEELDAGILWQLILRKVDLGERRAQFIKDPTGTARVLMSRMWR